MKYFSLSFLFRCDSLSSSHIFTHSLTKSVTNIFAKVDNKSSKCQYKVGIMSLTCQHYVSNISSSGHWQFGNMSVTCQQHVRMLSMTLQKLVSSIIAKIRNISILSKSSISSITYTTTISSTLYYNIYNKYIKYIKFVKNKKYI